MPIEARAALIAALLATLTACSASAPPASATPPDAVLSPPASAAAPAPLAVAPSASAAPSATPAVAPPAHPGPSYVACGCGCCGGAGSDPILPRDQCLYHAKGDTLAKVIADDQRAAKSEQCKLAGCSLGTRYVFCD